MRLLAALATLALAGYGDAVDGHPSAPERAVHVWIDAARAAPADFEADYADGGCAYDEFEAVERGFHTPLWWIADLAVTARSHAQDMDEHEFLGHTSTDGTTWEERLDAVYPYPSIGETVAYDSAGTRHAVLSTWMCSPPHRAILLGDYDEMGAGVSGSYYAVDVGDAGRGEWPLVPSASQQPAEPSDEVTFRAVWFATVFATVEVILDGEPYEMELVAGQADRGLYEVTLPTDGGCHAWWIRGTFGTESSEHRWPQDGSYGWGDCDWTDADARWLDAQAEPPSRGTPPPVPAPCACSSAPAGLGALWLLPLWIRRRRA